MSQSVIASFVGILLLAMVIGGFLLLLGVFFVSLWNRKYAVAIAIGVFVLIVILVPAVFLTGYKSYERPAELANAPQTRMTPFTPEAVAPTVGSVIDDADSVPAPWQEIEAIPFEANVYLSAEEAARQAVSALKQVLANQASDADADATKPITQIQLNVGELAGQQPRASVVAAALAQLRSDFPEAMIGLENRSDADGNPPHDDTATMIVSLSIRGEKEIPAPWESRIIFEPKSTETQMSGELIVKATTNSGSVDVEIDRDYLENKSWLTNFSKFTRERPGERYAIGFSSEFTSSEALSVESAIENVRSQYVLFEQVRMLNVNHFVVDRFSQLLSRPYGDVWRSAVLVVLPSTAMESQFPVASPSASDRHRNWFSSLIGLAILFATTLLITFVMNSLTQGYYRGRIAAGLAGILVIVIVLVSFY